MARGKAMDSQSQAEMPPRDFAALREKVIARWEELPRRLTQVAEYALNNPDDVAFGTAASIAAKAQVQPSTLVRFSQAFGYQGFSDLQDVFRSRLRDHVLGYDERMAQLREHGEGSPRASMILEGFAEASLRSISALTSRHDPAVFERALDVLEGAQTVYLIGLRRSFPVTSYMAYAMGKLGIRTILVNAVAGLAAEQAGFAGEGDVAIAISFTPYASETVALTAQVREAGAKVVAITDSIFSPLASQADVWFEIAEADFEGFRSMSATMTLAMALTVALADRRKGGGPRA
ncbi:MurR/RpiR family transcriptional regulator [Pelagibacterium sp. H642]|uniref:MurR/RpiR family transcriptional regulator n=1 Tax=Pelagibacterium sp. H642 TaxID=1881069 RepID=UPI002814F55C|nr:MurR/RpiR family transcriptional regulator [Pelagibacterium sp. H642]WMT91629.1 MurR/RpiR family transcriptional regulator [Pelagibacterium sp. H642]